MKWLKPAQAKRKKKKLYIYFFFFLFSFVEIHAQANSTILLTNITSPTNIIPISLSVDFHFEKMEGKHPRYITPQILSQYVIYLNEETNEVISIFFLIIKHVHSCLKTCCSDIMLNYWLFQKFKLLWYDKFNHLTT